MSHSNLSCGNTLTDHSSLPRIHHLKAPSGTPA